MPKSPKYYVVWKGRTPGVYRTWEECKAQVDRFVGAKYKAYPSLQEALAAYDGFIPLLPAVETSPPPVRLPRIKMPRSKQPLPDSFCVDAACSGNPGRLEFRCVELKTKRTVFRRGPFPEGTNNIGEFLAIVQALQYLQQKGSPAPVYSDSLNAIKWVHIKKCRTRLVRRPKNAVLFDLIAEAEAWLQRNEYPNKVLKWKTEQWGEIPADYGRK